MKTKILKLLNKKSFVWLNVSIKSFRFRWFLAILKPSFALNEELSTSNNSRALKSHFLNKCFLSTFKAIFSLFSSYFNLYKLLNLNYKHIQGNQLLRAIEIILIKYLTITPYIYVYPNIPYRDILGIYT
ncbi:hypothetical protein PUW84_00695 [Metamycoplasma hyosynoviae]|uniref:hypothetical protein n=1 Tax=Metamycoplasma hyosynoviae TaxID=29559 RepID=UPI002365E8CC|nr:hypothetical protein [Metamycoplasma hyosynoviae]MDD7893327.1 hypothetical protein [Metamycoplasma hyosynoviae]